MALTQTLTPLIHMVTLLAVVETSPRVQTLIRSGLNWSVALSSCHDSVFWYDEEESEEEEEEEMWTE